MEQRVIPLPLRLNETKTILVLMTLQFVALTLLAITVMDLQALIASLESELIRLHNIGRELLKTPAPTFTATVELTPKSSEK